LQAAVVRLTARHRVSRRGICELVRDLFDVTLSIGSADAICQRASDALAGPHCQLQDWMLDQGRVHVDETGWRTRGEGRALWTATTAGAAFFQIAEHCHRQQFDALVGSAYPGIVVSDRWNGFSHLDPNQRQVCWSHLQRDFRRHADGLGEQKTFGERGLPLTHSVFAAWRSYQHEHHDRSGCSARSRRSEPNFGNCSTKPAPRTGAIAGTDGSRTTCSNSGPRSGPSR
jgi:transposase